jgi:hypothetical protein
MNKILEIKFGSHLYGTNTPESDLDYKAIYVPTAKEIVLGNYPKTIQTQRNKAHGERNTKDDVDVETVSLDRFLELLCDGQTMALDMLFAPPKMFVGFDPLWADFWIEIVSNKHEFLSSNVNAFVGYARQQAAKYGVKGTRMDALKNTLDLLAKLPPHDKLIDHQLAIVELVEMSKHLISLEKTPLVEIVHCAAPNGRTEPHLHVAGRKIPFHALIKYGTEIFGKIYKGYGERAFKAQLAGGKDYKALSHAVRVNSEAKELLETGKITFPRPDADLLLKIKKIEMPFEEISEVIEQGLADLMIAQEKSTLRAEPNREYAQDIVFRAYTKIVKDSI